MKRKCIIVWKIYIWKNTEKILTFKAKVRRCDNRTQGLLNAEGYNITEDGNFFVLSQGINHTSLIVF